MKKKGLYQQCLDDMPPPGEIIEIRGVSQKTKRILKIVGISAIWLAVACGIFIIVSIVG